jgi:hypothetical protein
MPWIWIKEKKMTANARIVYKLKEHDKRWRRRMTAALEADPMKDIRHCEKKARDEFHRGIRDMGEQLITTPVYKRQLKHFLTGYIDPVTEDKEASEVPDDVYEMREGLSLSSALPLLLQSAQEDLARARGHFDRINREIVRLRLSRSCG